MAKLCQALEPFERQLDLPHNGRTTAPPREDITVRLVREFKKKIRSGALLPGGRLPPERELAGNLGVNRSSLRQALKVLQLMGCCTSGWGTGQSSDLKSMPSPSVVDPVSGMESQRSTCNAKTGSLQGKGAAAIPSFRPRLVQCGDDGHRGSRVVFERRRITSEWS